MVADSAWEAWVVSGGVPIIVGFNGGGFGNVGGFSGYPVMGGFGSMGGFCGF